MSVAPDRIEASALGELDDTAAAAVEAHLAGCARCAGEAGRFVEERRLFARRAALPAPAPPPFAAVLARARSGASSPRPRRIGMWSALAAAAALALGVQVASRRPTSAPHPDEAAAIVAEPAPSGEACTNPRGVAEGAAVREEHAYGACLMGTPDCAAGTPEPHEATRSEDDTCSVTCEACGPHPDEALEARTPGECAP